MAHTVAGAPEIGQRRRRARKDRTMRHGSLPIRLPTHGGRLTMRFDTPVPAKPRCGHTLRCYWPGLSQPPRKASDNRQKLALVLLVRLSGWNRSSNTRTPHPGWRRLLGLGHRLPRAGRGADEPTHVRESQGVAALPSRDPQGPAHRPLDRAVAHPRGSCERYKSSR